MSRTLRVRHARTVRSLAASGFALAVGCHDGTVDPATSAPTESVSLSVIPSAAAGATDIRGVVIRSTPAGADIGTVAGVRITVRRVDVEPGAVDTASARKTLTQVGVVTSAADGSFTLPGVGRGYFALDAEPPTGSDLRGGRAWSVSLPPTDPARARVYLYPR
jgi:hypothetical protein